GGGATSAPTAPLHTSAITPRKDPHNPPDNWPPSGQFARSCPSSAQGLPRSPGHAPATDAGAPSDHPHPRVFALHLAWANDALVPPRTRTRLIPARHASAHTESGAAPRLAQAPLHGA